MSFVIRVLQQTVLALLLVLLSFPVYAVESITFYHSDAVGTPLAMSNEDGSLAWEAIFLPFGEEYTSGPIADNNRRFVGKEKDSESGLGYFGARYLSVEEGRFQAPDIVRVVDPTINSISAAFLVTPQKQNLYTYSLNNSFKFIDPDGFKVRLLGSKKERKKLLSILGKSLDTKLDMDKDGYVSGDFSTKSGYETLGRKLRGLIGAERTVNIQFGGKMYTAGTYKFGTVKLDSMFLNNNKSVNTFHYDAVGEKGWSWFSSQGVMTHELLGHAHDNVFAGASGSSRGLSDAEVRKWENRAIRTTNSMRRLQNIPQRYLK